jgi:hypothetical protein
LGNTTGRNKRKIKRIADLADKKWVMKIKEQMVLKKLIGWLVEYEEAFTIDY